jgi:peptide/nickel transport system ATP-binding protein
MALLETENLSVSIKSIAALKGISFSIGAGEILGLVGESGAGKSIAGLSILGLLPTNAVASGVIRFGGRDLLGLDERALCAIRGSEIGFIFQEPALALNPLMTIGDQIAESVRLHKSLPRKEARAAARAVLDRVGLPEPEFSLGRYPHELSGGQRQRVAIAIAIVCEPKLLIADEPTTALDVTTQAQILTLLKSLVDETGMSLILISHDLAVVSQMADRIAVMKSGEIVEHGPAQSVLRTPSQDYTKTLIASAVLEPLTHRHQAADVLLEVRDLRREYAAPRGGWRKKASKVAVDGVSLRIGKGERVGLVGESGSGKSSLLRMILALDRPQSGEVFLSGRSFSWARGSDMRTMRRRIQAVFQDPYGSFDPRMRVGDIVAEPLYLLESDPSGPSQNDRVAKMLERVGLSAADAQRYPHQFSGGQRQRIAIARALIIEPEIVVLDEAVSALDNTVRAQILSLLTDLSSRLNLSYLFVSHDLGVVRAVTDRVMVMQNGMIVEEGDTEKVFAAPSHPYTRSLLAATPRLEIA